MDSPLLACIPTRSVIVESPIVVLFRAVRLRGQSLAVHYHAVRLRGQIDSACITTRLGFVDSAIIAVVVVVVVVGVCVVVVGSGW